MTAIATILPNGRKQWFDASGNPLAGGSVAYYVPGTTTLKTTWQDGAQATPNQNPITLDAAGSALVWGSGSYREYVTDALGNLISDSVTSVINDASQFTYTPPGNNAIARSASSKFAEWVSSADYGCVGDGTTDDTTDFMRAVSAAITLGVPLLVTGLSGHVIRLSSPQTIGCALVFAAGGQIKPDSAAKITLSKGVMAPNVKIFSGAGAVSIAGSANLVTPVAWFGAVGDGTTDDTAAVQAAVSACPGGRVAFGAATYLITGTITCTASAVELQGAGQYATVLNFTNGAADCFTFEGAAPAYIYGNAIRDMSITCTSKTGGRAAYLTYVCNFHMERVYINNCWTGIDINIVNTVTLRDVSIAGIVGGAGAYGIYFRAPTGSTSTISVELNLFNVLVNALWSGADGIWWDGYAETLNAYLVVLLDVARGMKIMNTAVSNAYYPQYGEFMNFVVDGASVRAVEINGGSHFHFTGCNLSNTSGETGQGGADDYALYIATDASGSATNEVYFVNTNIGLSKSSAVYTAAKNVTFDSCRFGAGTTGTANTVPAVHVASGSTDTLVSNCWNSYYGSPNNWSYGVQADAGTYRTFIQGGNYNVGSGTGTFLNNSGDSNTFANNYIGAPSSAAGPVVLFPQYATAPANPIAGETFFNTSTNVLQYWNGSAWTNI